jgi:hypothetical protein
MFKFWRLRKERKVQIALGLLPRCSKCNDTGKRLSWGSPFYEPCTCGCISSIFTKNTLNDVAKN